MNKTAIISILGRPNAGKSTLLNQIIGQKISIVTPKVQTTRSIIKGIYTKDNTQLVFLDTPGIFNPKKRLEKAMVRNAWSSIAGADIICLIVDLKDEKIFDSEFSKIIKHISELDTPKIIIFNKIDLVKKQNIINSSSERQKKTLNAHDEFNIFAEKTNERFLNLLKLFPSQDSVFISAKSNKNIDKLIQKLSDLAPAREWMYSEDEITTAPMRFLSSEVTREQLFLGLSEELPYNLTVETDSWEQVSPNEAKVHQTIIVGRDTHKKIILGKNGQKIKDISTKSRIEISKNLDMKIHLFLFVKVREEWDNKSIYYNNMGLTFVKD